MFEVQVETLAKPPFLSPITWFKALRTVLGDVRSSKWTPAFWFLCRNTVGVEALDVNTWPRVSLRFGWGLGGPEAGSPPTQS